MTEHDVLAALHELVGHCGHCGKRSCPGRDSHSTLPTMLSTDDVCRALKMAKRATKKRRQCARDTAWISKAERGGDSGNSAGPMNRVRESARDTGATGDGDGLGPAAVPGNVGAQAGDRSQISATGSASPSNVSPKDGQHGEPLDAVRSESSPSGGLEGAGAKTRGDDTRPENSGANGLTKLVPATGSNQTGLSVPAPKEVQRDWKFDGSDGGHKYDVHGTSDCAFDCGSWAGPFRSGAPDGIDPLGACPKNPLGKSGAGATPVAGGDNTATAGNVSPAPAPDELCDIDDLPDCLVGGVHQPHCRHAGKPVTKGGNP